MVMKKSEKKRQIDKGSGSQKRDVLRAADIVPDGVSGKVKKSVKASDIPKFDLAEDIMAQQRKITANRRKSPVQKSVKSESVIEPLHIKRRTAQAQRPGEDVDKVIAEIVARDIENLCRG